MNSDSVYEKIKRIPAHYIATWPSGRPDRLCSGAGTFFFVKIRHLKTFPFTYDISSDGRVRKKTNTGFIYFPRTDEETGTYVHIELNGKTVKCLLAELVLLNFNHTYSIGDSISYKDGNMHHIDISNLGHKKIRDLNGKYVVTDKEKIGHWRCASRAESSNKRYAHLSQTITPNDVLRTLIVFGFRCFYCGISLNSHTWNLDHYIPKSKGGNNDFENLRPSCKLCNSIKSDMTYEQMIKKMHQMLTYFVKHNPNHEFSASCLEKLSELKYYSNGA